MKSNKERAEEYATGMMGEPYEFWTHHADKTLFNTIKKSFEAGTMQATSVDIIAHINSLKAPLIEQIQRHDWRAAVEIVNAMFPHEPLK